VAAGFGIALREAVLREKYAVNALDDLDALRRISLRRISVVDSTLEHFVLLEIARQGPFFNIMVEEDCPSTLVNECLARFPVTPSWHKCTDHITGAKTMVSKELQIH
jgi:hypothetical protein